MRGAPFMAITPAEIASSNKDGNKTRSNNVVHE
jgi:hypothetical protein